jgi:hypothetical protein
MRSYFGVLIHPHKPLPSQSNPGGFRWWAHINGRFVYAQTLTGMREMIREGSKP